MFAELPFAMRDEQAEDAIATPYIDERALPIMIPEAVLQVTHAATLRTARVIDINDAIW